MKNVWCLGPLKIRFATEDDIDTVLYFIKALAEYEKMTEQVIVDINTLHQSLFIDRAAEVLLLEKDNLPIGFAVIFSTFSTFVGRQNLYLEDIFITPSERHKGYGKWFFKVLTQIALARQCERFEWTCLNWNQSAIDFYLSLGAKPLDTWTTFRLDKEAIKKCANKNSD